MFIIGKTTHLQLHDVPVNQGRFYNKINKDSKSDFFAF